MVLDKSRIYHILNIIQSTKNQEWNLNVWQNAMRIELWIIHITNFPWKQQPAKKNTANFVCKKISELQGETLQSIDA